MDVLSLFIFLFYSWIPLEIDFPSQHTGRGETPFLLLGSTSSWLAWLTRSEEPGEAETRWSCCVTADASSQPWDKFNKGTKQGAV